MIKKVFKIWKALITAIFGLFVITFIVSCGNNQVNSVDASNEITQEVLADSSTEDNNNEKVSADEEVLVENVTIHKDEKFGGIFIDKSTEDLDALGFMYGDSVDVTFSNGYECKDIPYYNGYYAKTGDPLLVGYPGFDDIGLYICNGDSIWDIAKVKESDTAKIVRHEKGKYLANQEHLNLKYTDNRDDYASDAIFANFRNVKVGFLKENILYRGASPIDNHHNRAKYANDLIEQIGVKYDVDLSDDEKDLKNHFEKDDFKSEYFKTLYDEGKVSVLSMNMNYKSKEFAKKVVKALTDMSKNPGPYYIHCVEGKDRTGFLLAVIEGLNGANYEEIINDYMITYDNYYSINEKNEKERYDIIKRSYIDDMLRFLADYDGNTGDGSISNEDIELKDLDWVNIMGRYLSNNGMKDEDIDNLYKNLAKE